jgi:hypothetical protein
MFVDFGHLPWRNYDKLFANVIFSENDLLGIEWKRFQLKGQCLKVFIGERLAAWDTAKNIFKQVDSFLYFLAFGAYFFVIKIGKAHEQYLFSSLILMSVGGFGLVIGFAECLAIKKCVGVDLSLSASLLVVGVVWVFFWLVFRLTDHWAIEDYVKGLYLVSTLNDGLVFFTCEDAKRKRKDFVADFCRLGLEET